MSTHSGAAPTHRKQIVRFVQALLVLASAALVSFAYGASNKENKAKLEEAMSYDGLEKIKVKGMDLVYTRPGASLAAYNKVMLEPIDVSFHKDWDPQTTGSFFKLSAKDREDIRTGVAKIVHEEFVKELQSKSSYQITNEIGPDVLRVKAIVANLYVNAPDAASTGRSKTYVSNAGEMTLIAELFDSESGQVLARVIDQRAAQDYAVMTMSSSVFNVAEARDIAEHWAKILRASLDRAHGIGKK